MAWDANYAGFVVAAYSISFVVLGSLVAFIVRRDRKLRAILKSKTTEQ